ncbi:hypothetical protein [Sulfuricurvum sp.]|uniref:hypothetical protein n=1 Tax=Sulfuricurvum sp. TaxID=2025608 RepID=UPI003BB16DFE
MALNKDAIINASDIKMATINVPEWGGEVSVKRPSIRERDALGVYSRKFLKVKPAKEGEELKTEMIKGEEAEKAFADFRLHTVGFALCDEKGNRLFNDDEIETALGKKSPDIIDRIFNELGNVFKDAA